MIEKIILIQYLIEELREMQIVMKEIAEQVVRTDNRYWKEQQEIQEYSEALKKEIVNNLDKNDEIGRMKN